MDNVGQSFKLDGSKNPLMLKVLQTIQSLADNKPAIFLNIDELQNIRDNILTLQDPSNLYITRCESDEGNVWVITNKNEIDQDLNSHYQMCKYTETTGDYYVMYHFAGKEVIILPEKFIANINKCEDVLIDGTFHDCFLELLISPSKRINDYTIISKVKDSEFKVACFQTLVTAKQGEEIESIKDMWRINVIMGLAEHPSSETSYTSAFLNELLS